MASRVGVTQELCAYIDFITAEILEESVVDGPDKNGKPKDDSGRVENVESHGMGDVPG